MKRQISSKDLTVGYGKNIVLGNINFTLEKGEILCLMGPNGSGKSTVIKTIIKQIKKLGGQIYLADKEIEKYKDVERATHISTVLTERINPELMTVEEVIATARFPYTNYLGKLEADDYAAIDQAINMVNGEDLRYKIFTELSDGQKQRVMLARAICQEAEIMILDEPTSFLDVRYKIEILGILKKLANQMDKTIIISLHEIDLIPKIADKIIQINGENSYSYGPPEEILNDKAIKNAFSIEAGSYSSLIGNIELETCSKKANTFVIGGCGKGISIYRKLNKNNLSFYSGILFENDLDTVVSLPLALDTIISRPFEEIAEEKIQKAKNLIDKVEFVIDCGADFVGSNIKNKDLLAYALKKNKKVIFIKARAEYEGVESYKIGDIKNS